ncbi:MAG: hypothetical protein J1F02_07010 [Lachnospiraceae bacterium]|nr:hypothetical protein [Lachnospiraceae bacterium]
MDEKKEHFFARHLEDLANRAYQGNYPVFTDFMTTKEYGILNKSKGQISGVTVVCWGGHEDCSHVIGGFFPADYLAEAENLFPVVCIRVQPKNKKYAQALSHRDYLGAILNLGMERSKIGDIRISGETAFVFCKKDFASFVIDNFTMVKHTPVVCELVKAGELPPQQYEEKVHSVASLRLDNVVAAMTGSARKKAAELITQGAVTAGHEERTSVSFHCLDGMIMTIRGYGKYKLEVLADSYTKKGKQKIKIYKYM